MPNPERIPPGQSLARKFPVLHYGPVPKTDLAGWDLRLWGEVKTPRSLELGGVLRPAAHPPGDGYPLRHPLEPAGYRVGGREHPDPVR